MRGKPVIALSILFLISSYANVLYRDVQAYPTEDVPCFISDYTGACEKWHNQNIKYHITSEIDEKYANYVRNALSLWQLAVDDKLTFNEVQYKHKADIAINILGDGVVGYCGDGAIACAELYDDNGDGYFDDVQVLLSNKWCREGKLTICNPVSNRIFYLTALHELGHGLGLNHVEDDGEFPVDIMNYMVAYDLRITDADLQTLNKLYDAKPKQNTVEIKNAPFSLFEDAVQFIPFVITINRGETVTWINNDDTDHDRGLHTVTSGIAAGEWGTKFDSGNKAMSPGDSFSVTFDEVGEYPYLCRLHPWHIGKVIVL